MRLGVYVIVCACMQEEDTKAETLLEQVLLGVRTGVVVKHGQLAASSVLVKGKQYCGCRTITKHPMAASTSNTLLPTFLGRLLR